MDNNNVIDEDLASFIAESREIIEDMEPQLVKMGEELENGVKPDEETVNFIFRGFHTIKGSAAFYQLDRVVSIAHKAETLLEYFRSGTETINPSCTDALCQAMDVMEYLFSLIESGESDSGGMEKVRSIVQKLNGRINAVKRKISLEVPPQVMEDAASPSRREDEERPYPPMGETPRLKLGKHVRIFISEARTMIKKIMGFSFMSESDNSSAYREDELEKGREICRILADSAGFLGFDHLDGIFERAFSWLKTRDKDMDVISSDVEVLGKLCDEALNALDFIENGDADKVALKKALEEDSVFGQEETRSKVMAGTHELKDIFVQESLDVLDRLDEKILRIREDQSNREVLMEIRGLFHQLKGSSGIMGLEGMQALCEKSESALSEILEEVIILDDWDLDSYARASQVIRHLVNSLEKDENTPQEKMDFFEAEPGIETVNQEVSTGAQGVYNEDGDGIEGSEDGELQAENIPGGVERRKTDRKDIRVSISRLDELINLVGELVIAENMVVKNPDIRGLELDNFSRAAAHLNRVVRDLQDVVLAVRMVPISGIFRKMIRLVHDFSSNSDKKVNLRLLGEDTEIDKTVAELISDPLVHLVRNAIDHGIRKKTESASGDYDGCILIEARHEGGEVLVIVKDNGAGLDTEKILAKALSMGIVTEEELPLSEKKINELIFHPGFSTCEDITDTSGRGVGMDIVKRNLERIKGRVDVYTRKDKGCTFVLRIPLTLAIIDGMLVRVGDLSYTIPLLSIKETVQVFGHQVKRTMDGQEMVSVRERLIPLIRIHDLYGMEKDETAAEEGLVVVVEHQNETAGLLIHEILGEQQAVVKGLSGYMSHVAGISGCTILGDGEVSLILDVGGLIQKARGFREAVEPTVH
jgi:two-component system chemotaxis sensor kinase CheA